MHTKNTRRALKSQDRKTKLGSPLVLPDEFQVRAHPPLAALVVLEAAICASTVALKAAHPRLDDADRFDWSPRTPDVSSAFGVIVVNRRLLGALDMYLRDTIRSAQELASRTF